MTAELGKFKPIVKIITLKIEDGSFIQEDSIQ